MWVFVASILSQSLQQGMPIDVGRKGGVAKRIRLPHTPVESSSSRCFVQDNGEPNPKRFTVTSTAIVTPYTSVATCTIICFSKCAQSMGIDQQTTANSSISVPLISPSQIQDMFCRK